MADDKMVYVRRQNVVVTMSNTYNDLPILQFTLQLSHLMNVQKNIQVAQDCAKIIEQLIYCAQQNYHKTLKSHSWSFFTQITQPILHYIAQMKSIIYQQQQTSLNFTAMSQQNDAGLGKGRIHYLWEPQRTTIEEQLQKTKQLLHEYKYKAQIYHKHWIAEMAQITDKNLQIATLKAQKEKLSKQITATLQLYKKQVELNSQLSKQCSTNYAAYLKESDALKEYLQKDQFKQSEIQEIEELKVEISSLNKVVEQFAQQSSTIQAAYNEVQKENKALEEEILNLKKEIKYLTEPKQWHAEIHFKNKHQEYISNKDKSMLNGTPTNSQNNDVFECTNESIRTRKKKKTEETNISKSASNNNKEEMCFFSQEDNINQPTSIENVAWKFSLKQDWQSIFSKTIDLISQQLPNHNILQISTVFCPADRQVHVKIYYQSRLIDFVPKVEMNYSLIKSKTQSSIQHRDHQKQVCDQLAWLSKRKARVVSINDLTTNSSSEQILTVIWYQAEAQ